MGDRHTAGAEARQPAVAVTRGRDGASAGMVAGAFLIALGCVLVWWGGRENISGALVLGAATIGFGVFVQHKLLPRTPRYVDPAAKPRKPAIILGVAAVATVVVGVQIHWASVVAIGVGLAAGVVAPSSLWVNRSAATHPGRYVFGGLAASAVGWVLVAFTDQRLVGAVLVLAGLILFRAGVLPAVTERKANLVCGAALAAFFAGVAFMGWAVRWTTVPPGLIGSFLISVSLMTLAVAWPKIGYWPIGVTGSRAVGVLLAFAGVFVIWAGGQADLQAWLLMLVLAAFGVALARSGELVVFGLIIAVALIWSLTDRTATEPLDPHPDAAGRILAIGDSYISGEGAPRYLEGTDVVGSNRNACRRAPTAYAYRVADELGMGLDFLACSGAKTADVLLSLPPVSLPPGDAAPYDHNAPPNCDQISAMDGSDQLGQMPDSPADIAGAYRQLYAICGLAHRDRIEVVLVSIGGNDSRFSEIARGCFLPGTCAELRELWLGNVETIGPSIREVYRSLKVLLPGVPIVAMPYPIMLNPEPCGWSLLDGDEHDFLVEFVTVLNQQVRVSAQSEGVHFFEQGLFAFEDAGARICDRSDAGDSVMNLISLQPPGGDVGARLNPGTWIHNSMHPRPDGHRLTADALHGYLGGVIDGGENPVPRPDALLEISGIRQTQPISVNPDALGDAPAACPTLEPGPFAGKLVLIDQETPDGDTRVPAINVPDAAPTTELCLREGGVWMRVQPGEAGLDFDDAGVLSFAPRPPDDGGEQWLLYRDRRGETRLRIVGFCSSTPGCPSSVDDWTAIQLSNTARVASAPVVISILAGWFITIGLAPRRVADFITDTLRPGLQRRRAAP